MENGATANCKINEPMINIAKAIRKRSRFINVSIPQFDLLAGSVQNPVSFPVFEEPAQFVIFVLWLMITSRIQRVGGKK